MRCIQSWSFLLRKVFPLCQCHGFFNLKGKISFATHSGPTGNLCLKVEHIYPIKEWSDGKTKKLEDRLADILAWLEIKGEEDEQRAIESAIWHKKYEEEKQKKKELQILKDEELAKFKGLFQSAERFQKAQYSRLPFPTLKQKIPPALS